MKKFSWPFSPGDRKKRENTGRPATGNHGEDMAVLFLEGLQYKVLARNYRQRFGELDIVAEDGDTLVFVEVKTRKNASYGNPFEAVDIRKQRKLTRMALDYISRNSMEERAARFDVVAVLLDGDAGPRIEHIRDAFEIQD